VHKLITIPILFAIILIVVNPPVIASTTTSSIKSFTIFVSHLGFNKTSLEFPITVYQGDIVRITFVYNDSDLNFDNPHQMRLDGYDITSQVISTAHKISTIEFTANQIGEFRFYCIIPCVGMENLQNGKLIVKIKPGIIIPTNIKLVSQQIGPSSVLINAMLYDNDDNPIPGVIINFYVNTTFGYLQIGSTATNNQGIATINYTLPTPRPILIIAVFKGSGSYMPSNTTIAIPLYNKRELSLSLPYVSGQNHYPDLRLVGVAPPISYVLTSLVLIVILSIWSLISYVAYQIFSMKKYKNYEKNSPNFITNNSSTSKYYDIIIIATPLFGFLTPFILINLNLNIIFYAISLIFIEIIIALLITLLISKGEPK